ncbi:MAG TPA: PKD domain-containing protein [Thermoanaerobaculia bacterium]|nr:PKD domain-containing protein [Thermoanaerobaculia bacterium]
MEAGFSVVGKEYWMFNRKYWTAAICIGLMALAGADRLWAADPAKKQAADLRTKMEAEGWQQISEAVFERQLGPGKVEHLGYGREGLAWTISKLTRQLESLMQEQESYPSEKLARIIDELSVKISRAKRELRNMPMGLSSMTAALTGPSCSNICYSATADAFHLTNVQGVKAVAEAKFNSTCGYSGDTYAYAYARATLNGTTNTVTQSDPDSGTNIISSATATANGGSISGIPCRSEASSYAQSSALGISYSTSDLNSGTCPPPPVSLNVTINGSTYEYFTNFGCRNVTWTSTVSNGTAPYTYQWKIGTTVVGTASSYTKSVCGNQQPGFTLTLNVTDNNSATGSDTHNVQVYRDICECGPCNGQICP